LVEVVVFVVVDRMIELVVVNLLGFVVLVVDHSPVERLVLDVVLLWLANRRQLVVVVRMLVVFAQLEQVLVVLLVYVL
jgi:hypothetical protein